MSTFIKLTLFGSCLSVLISSLGSVAQPLQGFTEQTEIPTRIQRPLNSVPNSVIQGNINQDQQQPSLVRVEQFNRKIPQISIGNQQILGSAKGGHSEYWVSWNVWRARIADAVWLPLKERRTIMWGMTRVDYDVTRDHHIHITSVHTPDPTGKSGQTLAAAIMQLDGSPLLSFPVGSQQTVHHNFNMDMGLPMPGKVHYAIHLPGGSEHVIQQW